MATESRRPLGTGAAVARPDVHTGEVPVAYVTVAPGAVVTERDLRMWAAGAVGEAAAAPKSVHDRQCPSADRDRQTL
jgi:acyl-CoA synthetase (AMP-forming)/AMP-acid ligase II